MSSLSQHLPRLLPLAASLGFAFGLTTHTSTVSAATLLVTDCSDGAGSGTLRHTIAAAAANDTVLIQAATCSKITVSGSQIVPLVTPLSITGPGSAQLTISGGLDASPSQYHRVFASAGSLTLTGMTIDEAKYTATPFPIGGCVYTGGNLTLSDVVMSNCIVAPTTGVTANTRGGAVYSQGSVAMINSNISGNLITASSSTEGRGAGVYAKNGLIAKYSTISNNTSLVNVGYGGGAFVAGGNVTVFKSTISHNSSVRGGGLFVAAPVGGVGGGGNQTISYSTISNNTATDNGGLELHSVDNTKTVKIVNSTISGNVVTGFQGGAGTYVPTKVYNSTIAFNRAGTSGFAVGLYSNQTIKMQSSIFANNTGNGSYDVGSRLGVLNGANNVITATTSAVPLGTISTCPKLGPLANNGAGLFTHALLFNSPAIDQGNLTGGSLTTDERGATRNVGGGVDIGSYERQASETQLTDDRIFYAEFESACF